LLAIGREVNREAGKWGSTMHTLPSIFCQLNETGIEYYIAGESDSFLSKTK
jgi:hypothetical protein